MHAQCRSATALSEFWYEMATDVTSNLYLILDASHGSEDLWSEMIRSVRQIGILSGPGIALYCIGNSTPFTLQDLLNEPSRYYAHNRMRARFIAPIFAQLCNRPRATVVILSAGRVFDFEDCLGVPPFHDIVCVRFASQALSDGSHVELSPEQFSAQWGSAVRSVAVQHPGLMPFWWNNPSFQYRDGRLVADCAEYSLRAGFLGVSYVDVSLTRFHADGRRSVVAGQPIESVTPSPTWTSMTTSELTRFHTCVEGRDFKCPLCPGHHPATQLLCNDDDSSTFLGTLVYPSLTAVEHGFILLRQGRDGLEWARHSCNALVLPDGGVAVRRGHCTEVYRFEPNTEFWLASRERLPSYQPLRGGEYALIP